MWNKLRLAMITTAFLAPSSMIGCAQTGGASPGASGTPGMSGGNNGHGANGTGTMATAGHDSTGTGYGSSTGPLTGEPGLPNNVSGAGLSGGSGGGLGGGSGGPAQAGAGMSSQ